MSQIMLLNKKDLKSDTGLFSKFKNYQKKSQRNILIGSILKKELKLPEFKSRISSENFVKRNFDYQTPVLISSIIGSENKTDEFDNNFFPTKNCHPQRWIRSANEIISSSNTAVKLIKFKDNYYAASGHYHISASKCLGIQYVDAKVVEYIPKANLH